MTLMSISKRACPACVGLVWSFKSGILVTCADRDNPTQENQVDYDPSPHRSSCSTYFTAFCIVGMLASSTISYPKVRSFECSWTCFRFILDRFVWDTPRILVSLSHFLFIFQAILQKLSMWMDGIFTDSSLNVVSKISWWSSLWCNFRAVGRVARINAVLGVRALGLRRVQDMTFSRKYKFMYPTQKPCIILWLRQVIFLWPIQ